jgi:hypothetical protein
MSCGAESLFDQVTVLPTGTVAAAGENAKFAIVTVPAATGCMPAVVVGAGMAIGCSAGGAATAAAGGPPQAASAARATAVDSAPR